MQDTNNKKSADAGERPLLSVVIPVYNERDTIEEIIRRVRATEFAKEILIVDDGSDDGTRDILRRYESDADIKLLFLDRNRGKGAALRTGFGAAAGAIVVVQDADLEYDPRDYPQLLDPILRGVADVVYGSRFQGPRRVHFFWHFVANRFITLLSNILTNHVFSDIETGYKAFTADVIRSLKIQENGFGVEPEITAKVTHSGYRVFEVGISYTGRDYYEGKKIHWTDGLWAVWCVLKYNIFRRHPRRRKPAGP